MFADTALRLAHHLEMHLASTTIVEEDLMSATVAVFALTKRVDIGHQIVKAGVKTTSLGLLLALQVMDLQKSVKVCSLRITILRIPIVSNPVA